MTHTALRSPGLGVLVAILCCAGLLAGAPTPAGAAPAPPPSSSSALLIALQLGELPAVVRHQRKLTLRASGAFPGATVQFSRTPAGGSAQSLGSTTADMDGTATLVVKALTNATYVASMELGGPPIESNTRSVGVTRRVGLARVVVDAARRTVRFTSTVSTGRAPGRLVLQRRRGDRWVVVGSWPARARVVRVVVVPRGRTVHRAAVKATRSYRTSVSRTVTTRLG